MTPTEAVSIAAMKRTTNIYIDPEAPWGGRWSYMGPMPGNKRQQRERRLVRSANKHEEETHAPISQSGE